MNDNDYFEREDKPHSFPWYLVTGMVLGLGLGLLISFVVSPVRRINTSPSNLAEEFKADYLLIIAQAYQLNPDSLRASQRLALLGDPNILDTLSRQAQLLLALNEEDAARTLADIAAAMGNLQITQAVGSPPQTHPTVTEAVNTRGSTRSPAVKTSITPSATQSPPYLLVDTQTICEVGQSALLQVEIRNSSGEPVPGVQISVAWDGGLDTFFTGLKPSADEGYADFQMTPGIVYSMRAGNSATVNDLKAPECTDSNGNPYAGSLLLVFGQ